MKKKKLKRNRESRKYKHIHIYKKKVIVKAYVPLARSSRKSAGFIGKDGEYPTDSK